VNRAMSSPNERADCELHVALGSILHEAEPQRSSTGVPEAREHASAPCAAQDDKLQETLQHDTALQLDGATMQVLLVSPPSAFRTTVSDVLRHIDPRCRITRATEASKSALARAEKASLALIDLDAYGKDGEALIREIAARRRGVPIVALSDSLENGFIDRAVEAGALGYLPKSYTKTLIECGLRMAIGGASFRPRGMSPPPAKRGRPRAIAAGGEKPQDISGLTPREKQILVEVARGCNNLKIAKRLGIREATVKSHLDKVYKKLHVETRTQAALYAMRLSEVQQTLIDAAEGGKLDLSWLQPEMSHRHLKAGQWIFCLDQPGDELFYVQRGRVALPELGETIGPQEVFGEIAIFAPGHKRTSSARCVTEVDLFTLSRERVQQIYFAKPEFAYFIVALIATRLMADRERKRT